MRRRVLAAEVSTMRLFPVILVSMIGTGGASAQVADVMSRGITPNAIDRSLSSAPTSLPDTRAALDRQRSDLSARTATTPLGPPPTSTTIDGPGGVQQLGSGALPPSSSASPSTPQF
ncbi:hypothetical protein F1C10_12790 [Sphingomonas sp. NBWT7]|uniref:hypothetical protein n=1 Tax=Sphingomonas sp. NBWT7 TaxID=2596913 RepID=UPI0016288196|nr:hypothetical protein [Sphingomonas sp. NBWT7]QNE32717.1 hypothetical protein F1C10_12790 [Sphingomonas sp. NBWT7]